jgi:hypothetical protein
MDVKSPLFQSMCLLVPIQTGQIPSWRNHVASIQFAVSEGAEIDAVESPNLFEVISFYFRQQKRKPGAEKAYTDTINVLRCVDPAEIDADAVPAVLAEHLVLVFGVEGEVTAADAAVVMPRNG